MKITFFAALMSLSFSLFAGPSGLIFPEVYNFGHSVQVTVRNHTNEDVRCTGSISMVSQTGQRDNESFYETVPAGMTNFKTFFNRRMGDRYVSVMHTISCY
jgi:hypothetical protein